MADATIDWTRGLLTASGAAPGDIRAPSPALARLAATRRARAQARARIAAAAEQLTIEQRPLSAWIAADATAAARFARALSEAIDLDLSYGSDGSVILRAAVPVEALRAAIRGAPVQAIAEPKETVGSPARARPKPAPTAIIVDARAVLTEPALGLALVAGGKRYSGPTVFYRRRLPKSARARGGARALRAKATSRRAGDLTVALKPARLAAAKAAHAVVIVLLAEP